MKIEIIKNCITPQNKDELSLIGYWPSTAAPGAGVPVYHVSSPQAFNQVVGYAKFINGSNGTVLYRGQSKNYDSLLPSGARKKAVPVQDDTINAIRTDDDFRRFFGLDEQMSRGGKDTRVF